MFSILTSNYIYISSYAAIKKNQEQTLYQKITFLNEMF